MNRNSWLSFIPAAVLALMMGMAGQAKVTDLLTPDFHKELASHAPEWSSVLPTHPSPAFLLQAIGWVEVAACILLLLPFTRRLGGLVVAAMMAGAVGTHLLLSQPFTFPAALAGAGLLVALVSGKASHSRAAKKRN